MTGEELQAELARMDAGQKKQALQKKIRALEQIVEQQQKAIDDLKDQRYKLPISKPRKTKGGTFLRAYFGDTHGASADGAAVSSMLADFERLDIREVVWLGDHLECGGFLSEHHVLGYVAQTDFRFQADVDAANDLLDRVQALTPHAKHYYLEGNHEQRLERWCVTKALRNACDAKFLLSLISAKNVLHLDKRGFDFVPVVAPTAPRRRGVLKLGKCNFTHGHTYSKFATRKHLENYSANIVHGHTHRAQVATMTRIDGQIIGASPGCLCELQPLWKHSDPTDWTHGYGVQVVADDGSFFNIIVPIISGKSYFQELASTLQ